MRPSQVVHSQVAQVNIPTRIHPHNHALDNLSWTLQSSYGLRTFWDVK